MTLIKIKWIARINELKWCAPCIFFRRSRSLNLRHIFPWKLIGLLFRLALQPSYRSGSVGMGSMGSWEPINSWVVGSGTRQFWKEKTRICPLFQSKSSKKLRLGVRNLKLAFGDPSIWFLLEPLFEIIHPFKMNSCFCISSCSQIYSPSQSLIWSFCGGTDQINIFWELPCMIYYCAGW